MAPISSLPSELLVELCSYFTGNYTDLYNFALVCREWRAPAQGAMFGTLNLSLKHPDRARAWLDSPGRAKFGTYRLALFSDRLDYPERDGLALLAACPDLRALDVCDPHDELDHLGILFPENFPLDAAPLSHRLKSLSLNISGSVSLSIVESIFSSSSETLSELHLKSPYDDSTVSHLLSYFGATRLASLRTLAIHFPLAHPNWESLITAFPQILHLELRNIDQWSSKLGESVSPNLQSLSFTGEVHFGGDAQKEELVKMLRMTNFSGLKQLNMPTVPQAELRGDVGRRLLDECQRRSVTVLCASGFLTCSRLAEEAATLLLAAPLSSR